MIIAGSASVVAAMMWLMNEGTMCTKMMRIWLQPTSRGRDRRNPPRACARNRPRTTRASSVQPSSEMMMRDGEVDLQHAPLLRQRRRQPHPQRDRRDRAEDLDDALDDRVGRRRRRSPRSRRAPRPAPGSCVTPSRPIVSEIRVAYISRDHMIAALHVGAEQEERLGRVGAVSTPIRWRSSGSGRGSWYSKPWAKKRIGILLLGSARRPA